MDIASVKRWLARHPRINFMQYAFRHKLNSKKICQEILKIRKDPLTVTYCHYGNKNKGKTIYYIYMGSHEKNGRANTQGFCSILKQTLLLLHYADYMGYIPVVEWGENLLYSETYSINGTRNSFEYFLKKVSEIPVEEIYESNLVVHKKENDISLFADINNADFFKQREIDLLAVTINKYLSFNQYGIEEIKNPCNKIKEKGKILGVHVRGTDFHKGYSNHPVPVSCEEFIKKTVEIQKKGNYEYIFLATDEESTVKEFQNVFKEKLLYYQSFRSKDGRPVHYGNDNNRKNHKYLLGMEIFRDVYTLGCCNGLIAGRSSVVIIALAFNKGLQLEYEDLEIIDKGEYHNLRLASKGISKSF